MKSTDEHPQLHRLLRRQLKRLGIDDRPPDPAMWAAVLQHVDRAYCDADRGQQMLERAIDISTREMSQLHEELAQRSDVELAAERTRLQLVFESVLVVKFCL